MREAENGLAGLASVRERAPALVLLDLLMPEMDGFGFLEGLRGDGDRHTPPVIVITAKVLTDEDRKRLNGGVETIVQKGGRGPEALVREIGALVASRSAGR